MLVAMLLISFSGCGNNKNHTVSEEKKKLKWPESGIAELLPKPKFEFGKVNTDSSDFLSVYCYDVSADAFDDYVEECKKYGFTENYTKTGTGYHAYNIDKYHLSLFYDKYEYQMDINFRAPDEDDINSEIESSVISNSVLESIAPEEEPSIEPSIEIVTPEPSIEPTKEVKKTNSNFRKWVDDYEKFMNKYCEFMKKADYSSPSYLKDFADLMSKYEKFIEDSEKLNEDDYSIDDWKYYMDAQMRILDKISKI